MRGPQETTRRAFLRAGAAAASAMALPAFTPRHVLGSTEAPGANEQIVLGIIGMGQRGVQLLGNIPQSGRVAAIFPGDEEANALLDRPRRRGWELPRV